MLDGTSEIEGLPEFLRILKLDAYSSEVSTWAKQMGAAFLEEIVEHAESLASDIKLKPLETKRLLAKGHDVCIQCLGKRSPTSMPAAKRQKVENQPQTVTNSTEEHAKEASEYLQHKVIPEWHPSQDCKEKCAEWKILIFELQEQSDLEPLSKAVGEASPMFAEFAYEDWALLGLRIELHLMLHDTLHTSTHTKDGLAISQLPVCYFEYYEKPWPEKACNKSMRELLKIMADTVKCSEADVLSPILPQTAALDDFIKLVEVQRCARNRWIEAGDELAEIRFERARISPPRKKKRICGPQLEMRMSSRNQAGQARALTSSTSLSKQQHLCNKAADDVTGYDKPAPVLHTTRRKPEQRCRPQLDAQTPYSNGSETVPSRISPLKQQIQHNKSEDVACSFGSVPSSSSSQSWQTQTPHGLEMEPSDRQVLCAEVVGHPMLQKIFAWNGMQGDASTDREDALKTRIRKMLELSFHPQTGEAESSQALRNAQKLMRSHHLEEADILCRVQGREAGGFNGVKLTPVKPEQKMRRNHEFWSKALMVAIEVTFDVGSFIKIERSQNSDFVIFYGGRTATELAAFAYCCASNRIDWMAGARSMPSDEVFGRGEQPAGKKFSKVLDTCKGYVEWVKYSDVLLQEESAQVKRFANYVRAWEDPVAWDQAYKEGMASKLMKQAKAVRKEELATSDALALNLKEVQNRMVEHLGLKLNKGKKLRGLDKCRQARQHGAADASAINLRQQQVEEGSQLALTAPS